MTVAIAAIEKEIYTIQKEMQQQNMLLTNRAKANGLLKDINALKTAIKFLKGHQHRRERTA